MAWSRARVGVCWVAGRPKADGGRNRLLSRQSRDSCAVGKGRSCTYSRHPSSEPGDTKFRVPRAHRFCSTEVVKKNTRHVPERWTAQWRLRAGAQYPQSGRGTARPARVAVSASTVSPAAKSLGAAVAAVHRWPLTYVYKVLLLDGVVLAGEILAGALRCLLLATLGISRDDKRGSSISAWPLARVPPNGNASSPVSAAGGPGRGAHWAEGVATRGWAYGW